MSNLTTKLLALTAAAATVLLTTGCSSNKTEEADGGWQDPFFPAKQSTPASKTIWETSYANAAVEDAMLFPIHFTGNELNGLGQTKVDRMMQGRPAGVPLMVYLNQTNTDPTNNARVDSITRAFKAGGLAENEFKVAVGPNPNTLLPASAGVRALAKAEGAGGGGDDDAAGAHGGAAASTTTP